MKYVCEVCGREAELTEEDAFEDGWDYPPFMGAWGVISSRKCGNCGIEDTAWWALMVDKIPLSDLSHRHKQTVLRILREVENDTSDS